MENKRLIFWKIAFVILVLLNICMLLAMYYRPESNHGSTGREKPDAFIIRELNFTLDQNKTYELLKRQHHDSMVVLNNMGNELRSAYFNDIKLDNVSQQADSLANLIAGNQKQIVVVTFNHFRQIRAICNDTQKTKFDAITGEVLKRMSGPMRGDHPPRPHGDGPPPREDGPEGHPPPPDDNH